MLNRLLQADLALRAWLTAHHSPVVDSLALALTLAGRRGMLFLALGLLLTVARKIPAAAFLQLVLAVALAGLAAEWIAKPLVARARPFDTSIDVRVVGDRPETFAFPSGHAATSFAGAYALSNVLPGWGRVVCWVLATLAALSRVYLGVHYPLDVIGGAVLGVACAAFALGGTKWSQRRARR